MVPMPDAVVIGAGPNGLVAANKLADAGWSVVVLEAADAPGGAVKSSELIEKGFVNDHFSAFFPLAAASPAIGSLRLEDWGLRFCHGPLVLAHPAASDGTCVVLSRDLDETAESLDAFATGDGDAWRRLMALWHRIRDPLLRGMVTPMPPVRTTAELTARLGPNGVLRLTRLALLPVRRFAHEHFRGAGAARLLAGNALHADLTPDAALGGFFGFLLCALGQDVGYPFPEGGAGALSAALVRRAQSRRVRIVTGARVTEIVVRRRAAAGVRLADGTEVAARRAVLADVDAPTLYLSLLPRDAVPRTTVAEIRRFDRDWGTVKVDWTLDAPIPWANRAVRRAPVVHLADTVDALSGYATELRRGLVPAHLFLVLGQYSAGDPTRAPAGKETAWAYTHVPLGAEIDRNAFAARMEDQIEALAPGFRALVRGRHVFSPRDFEAADASLVGGAVNGGTAQIHQQLVFRPVPGLGRPETPVARLYLASSSAHPGGGVHGGPGAIAARAALTAWRTRRAVYAVAAALTMRGAVGLAPRGGG
jgi:phytoene dehydrogenase-like protein